MYFTGIVIAISTFLIIGFFHPIVIKAEYYTGTRLWWVFLLVGLMSIVAALFIEDSALSAIIGVFGASALWGIGELFARQIGGLFGSVGRLLASGLLRRFGGLLRGLTHIAAGLIGSVRPVRYFDGVSRIPISMSTMPK